MKLPGLRHSRAKLPVILFTAILALLPFHALLTAWAGSNFGHYRLIQLWKEFLLLGLLAGVLFTPQRRYLLAFIKKHRPLSFICAVYILLFVVGGLVAYRLGNVNRTALAFSWVTNLRLLLALAAGVAVGPLILERKIWWRRTVLIPAAAVVPFGLVQEWFLAPRFLEHLGYSMYTILPFQYVDNRPEFLRAQSTLRGANPLGAYLVFLCAVLLVLLVRARTLYHRLIWGSLLLVTLLLQFYTYSRSAWLGGVLAIGAVAWLALSHQWRVRFGFIAVGLVCALSIGLAVSWQSSLVQNTLLHTDRHSKSPVTSNEQRLAYETRALGEVAREPLGRGPGTAGPASTHNTHEQRLAENYFLQIGQEVGWLGLALFIALNAIVGRELWSRRRDPLALALLASLAGLTLVNLLSHAWTDDTLALLWWGLAGTAITPAILKSRHKHEDQTNQRN